jgi:phage pi2 protein 07
MTKEQIWIMVIAKYPKTESERNCLIEKRMMDMVREAYRKRLENECEAKTGILDESGET